MARILCVEDGADTIAILELTLKAHSTKFVRTLKDARKVLPQGSYDLVLLDVELPDGSGLELMSELEGTQSDLPVIFLTGKKDFGTKATAFTLGAEDYLVKPFDPSDLRLRVDSKIRKRELASAAKNVIRLGNVHCHLDEQRVENRKTEKSIELTAIEFKILALLGRTPNKIFSRNEILDRVWGPAVAVTERAIDVHVSNLRRKLSDTGTTIESAIGVGYRISVGPEA